MFSEASSADYAVLHVIGQHDLARGGSSSSDVLASGGVDPWDTWLFPTTFKIVHGLPDVYWSNVLGNPYVRLIGCQRLLSCLEANIEEFAYGGVRITSRLPLWAAVTQPEEFEAWRERVRAHIGREFFWDALAYGREVRVPEFAWGEE